MMMMSRCYKVFLYANKCMSALNAIDKHELKLSWYKQDDMMLYSTAVPCDSVLRVTQRQHFTMMLHYEIKRCHAVM